MAGLWDALKQYIGDALPGGALNPETQPVATQANYLSGILDPASQVSQDAQAWHKRTQNGLMDQLAGRDTPEAEQAYQTMMQAAGIAPVGMFIGKGAKTWDAVMMGKAQKMAQEGADPRAIWKETGTWQGPDGQWRQEIPDNKSVISDLRQKSLDDVYPLPDVLQHNGLYEAYPQLKDSQVWPVGGRGGAYSNGNIDIGVDRPPITGQRKTALHEVQHNIQDVEDWAKGGSSMMAFANKDAFKILGDIRKNMRSVMPVEEYASRAWGSNVVTKEIADDYAKNYLKTAGKVSPELDRAAQETAAKEYYKRLAGEAEARATQARMNMDAAQRRATFPADSYDVPLDSLIVRR